MFVLVLIVEMLAYLSIIELTVAKFERISNVNGVMLIKSKSIDNRNMHQIETIVDNDRWQLELLMIADYSMYESFLLLYNNDHYSTRFAIEHYLTTLFNQIRLFYDRLHIDTDQQLHLILVGTFVSIRHIDCPLQSSSIDTDSNQTINAIDALHRMHIWLKRNREWLPTHDHAAVITKFDLRDQQSSITQGMAYVGSICRYGESASLAEDVGGMATAVIIAHELAHSLGAHHDGFGSNEACKADANYLMAPYTSTTQKKHGILKSFQFSNCSLQQIRQFFKDRLFQTKCLKLKRKRAVAIENVHQLQPGIEIDASKQCKLAFNSIDYGSCPHRKFYKKIDGSSDICNRLWCKNRKTKRMLPCETKSYLPAFDGTKCGFEKWCVSGRCESINNSTINGYIITICINIPIIGIDCNNVNNLLCSSLSTAKLKQYCKSQQYKVICCRSCAEISL